MRHMLHTIDGAKMLQNRARYKKSSHCASPKFWMAPRVGFEPTTYRLTAECSAVELPRNEMVGVIRFELMTSSV